jgi:hypothetical protein
VLAPGSRVPAGVEVGKKGVRAREGRRRGSKAGVSAYLYIARIADFFSVIEAFSILAEL